VLLGIEGSVLVGGAGTEVGRGIRVLAGAQVLQPAHGPARDVVRAGAVVAEARQGVEVDFVDQAAGGPGPVCRSMARSSRGVVVGSVQADPDRLGDVAFQEGDTVDATGSASSR
jgi:hypothetical protein